VAVHDTQGGPSDWRSSGLPNTPSVVSYQTRPRAISTMSGPCLRNGQGERWPTELPNRAQGSRTRTPFDQEDSDGNKSLLGTHPIIIIHIHHYLPTKEKGTKMQYISIHHQPNEFPWDNFDKILHKNSSYPRYTYQFRDVYDAQHAIFTFKCHSDP
jgi:hypothetical protein